jgi:inner membrane protein
LKPGPAVPDDVYRTGHWGAALLAYAPLGYLLLRSDPILAFVGAGVVLWLSTLPDIDMRLPVRHRGPTHSLLFLGVVAAVLGAAGGALGVGTYRPVGVLPGVGLGVLLGVVGIGSHLLADMLTPAGVNLFWPLPAESKSFSVARADNTLANYGLLGLGVAASAGALYLAGPV